MLAFEIIRTDFPLLKFTDNVAFALDQMEQAEVQHLPVIDEEKFIGTIGKHELMDADESIQLADLKHEMVNTSVFFQNHFLSAVKVAASMNISLVPVVNEANEYLGAISETEMVLHLSQFLNAQHPGGLIVMETEKHNFSFSELSRLVETNDAYITQLNTTIDEISGLLVITIKINKTEISDIIATLQRYDFSIKYYFGEEHFENELKENYDLLMAYLRI